MTTATLFGIIVGTVSGADGWYRCMCSAFATELTGVSIKGTPFYIGQHVAVVQSGSWTDSRRGFAFAGVGSNIYSHIELSDTRNWVIENSPIGASLAFLWHKAGKAQELYHPARVTAVGANSLTVKDWYTDQPLGSWAVASDLKASDFTINDGVLLRLIPEQLKRVEGWWQTVPTQTATRMYGFIPIHGGGVMGVYWDLETSRLWQYDTNNWSHSFFPDGFPPSGRIAAEALYATNEMYLHSLNQTVFEYDAAPNPNATNYSTVQMIDDNGQNVGFGVRKIYSYNEISDPRLTLAKTWNSSGFSVPVPHRVWPNDDFIAIFFGVDELLPLTYRLDTVFQITGRLPLIAGILFIPGGNGAVIFIQYNPETNSYRSVDDFLPDSLVSEDSTLPTPGDYANRVSIQSNGLTFFDQDNSPKTVFQYTSNGAIPGSAVYSFDELPAEHFTLVGSTLNPAPPLGQLACVLFAQNGLRKMRYKLMSGHQIVAQDLNP